MSSLADRALKASLTLRSFHSHITLKGMGRDVEKTIAAGNKTIKDPQQKMFAEWKDFQEVKALQAKAYQWFQAVTVPWDKGSNIMPTKDILDNLQKFGELKAEVNSVLERMASEYDTMVDKDKALRGPVAQNHDYPPAFEDFRARFGMELSLDPLGNPNDIRNVEGLSEDEANELVASAEARMKDKMKSILEKLMKPLTHLKDILADGDKFFKVNSIDNLKKACQMVRDLTDGKDQEIEDILTEVEASVKILDADVLRENKQFRETSAKNLNELSEKMKSFLS